MSICIQKSNCMQRLTKTISQLTLLVNSVNTLAFQGSYMKKGFAHGLNKFTAFSWLLFYPFKNNNEILESPWKILLKFQAKRK